MPLYYFQCPDCGESRRKFLTPKKSSDLFICSETCSGILLRTPRAPSSRVVERIDNGLMPRAIERPSEAERLYKERSRIDPLKD